MFPRLPGRLLHYSLLIATGLFLFFANLGGPSLWDIDEGRNATASLEMFEANEWVVPTFNGQLRDHKPVLLYWLQIIGYHLFGISEFTARLPSALAALLTVLLVYELGRAMFDAAVGLLGGVIFASSPLVCGAARFANQDALLSACSVLAMLCFWRGFSRTGRFPFVSCSIACGFGVLAKGPVGVVLPFAAVFLFLLWTRKLRVLLDWRLAAGFAAFGLVVLPWYILVTAQTQGNFLLGFLGRHNVERFLSPMERHGGGPFYYLVLLPIVFAPWSVFLGMTLWNSFSGKCRNRFLLCWVGVYLCFFTIAQTKLPNYILPLMAPLVLLTANALVRWRRGELQLPTWAMPSAFVLTSLIGIVTALGLLAASGVIPLPVNRMRIFPGLAPWAALGAVPFLGAAAAWRQHRRGQRQRVITAFAVSSILFVGPLVIWGPQALNAQKTPRSLVEQSNSKQRTRDIRIGCYNLAHLPSLNFYCQRDVKHFFAEKNARAFLRDPLPVFLFLPENSWKQMRRNIRSPFQVLATHFDFYRGGNVVVVTNRQ